MKDNITREDLDTLIEFLKQEDPMLTQGKNVLEFEREWSKWLGAKYSVFVNSGSSANLITLSALRESVGLGEIIVPPLTWVSDIASVIQCGFKPIFADINLKTLGMDTDKILEKITPYTKAVFITHILGFNALTQKLLDELKKRNIPLIEDACESHGATFNGKKVGTFGLMSNFSFYYAHHMSTIEGGMVSTNDSKLYEMLRMFRAHGMVRESIANRLKQSYYKKYSDLNPDFIFAFPAFNVRSTEISAVLGRAQIKKLDSNNKIRSENFRIFLENLDKKIFYTDFDITGSSNYAFILILKNPDMKLCKRIMTTLHKFGIEFRRGTSGGGNQLRQPYLKKIVGEKEHEKYPNVEHIHFYGFYIGNYPTLDKEKILKLCAILNNIK
ncbi:MAG: DegT/DnrJ/EryC1/StrS family aminotransferase [Candidatus Levyibacteriota bacterium]|nr:MAG: DegT/DnrJ/EryC1/StrS family aminotransferase [Candidatus Levybacteria bacterium]